MKKSALILALWLIGCGGTASETGRTMGCGWTPDPYLHGAHLDNECHAEWCRNEDLRPRLRRTIEVAADYWNTDIDILWGWKIRIVDDKTTSCLFRDTDSTIGCTDWLKMTITIGNEGNCIEETALIHEVGHVISFMADPTHIDGRFKESKIQPYKASLTEDLWESVPQFCDFMNFVTPLPDPEHTLFNAFCYTQTHGTPWSPEACLGAYKDPVPATP